MQDKVPLLLTEVRNEFPVDWVWTEHDRAAHEAATLSAAWPSVDEMRRAGRRLMLVSRRNYSTAMWPLIFPRCVPPLRVVVRGPGT